MLAMALCCAVLAAQVNETITVSRVVIDVRVTKSAGEPIADLNAEDFDVRVEGKRAIVESAEWIDDTAGSSHAAVGRIAPTPGDDRQSPTAGRQPGRLIVLFVQTDFARNTSRMHGQIKFLQYADDLLAKFEPEDRIAVFSFDSHLKFRLDFSSDRQAILEAVRSTIYIDHPPPPPIVPSPSLAANLDRDAMRRAASSETALLLIGNALRSINGPKSLLLLGWGLGQLNAGGVSMKSDWKAARGALDAARVSIFALDTTYADYHDLELGLMSAAEQTGGFYAKTHITPSLAIDRLQRTLSGHYELTLRANLPPGTHDLTVRVQRRGATVLAPSSVWIRR